MPKHLLTEPFDISGEWFHPDKPDRKIAGRLLYKTKFTELHLNEAFEPLQGSIAFGHNATQYPVIHGNTTNGEAVTLLKAYRTKVSIHIGSGGMAQPEQLISSWLLIGAHFPKDFLYPEISFRIPGLQVWLVHKSINHSFEEDKSTNTISQSYQVLPLGKYTTSIPLIDASLNWEFSFESTFDVFSSVSVKVFAWITIKPSAPKPIEWFFEQHSKISALLTFLSGTPMSPDCIEASFDNSHHKASVLVALSNTHYCSYKNPSDFFMTSESMGSTLTDVVTKWFEVHSKVNRPSQLAISILASEKMWPHVEFLSLMQALEGFHRGLYSGIYTDDEKYQQVMKILNDAIPRDLDSDHKDSLRSRIRYGNQISLRKRLDELSNLISDHNRKIILGERGDIPRTWIDTRNYFTHWDDDLRSNILDNQSLYNANIRLRQFLRVLYIQLMGISQDSINTSLSNSSDISQHLIQINNFDRLKINPDDKSGVILSISEAKDQNNIQPNREKAEN